MLEDTDVKIKTQEIGGKLIELEDHFTSSMIQITKILQREQKTGKKISNKIFKKISQNSKNSISSSKELLQIELCPSKRCGSPKPQNMTLFRNTVLEDMITLR